MRILQVCPRFPYPLKDGGTIAMYNMIAAYHEAGHEVTVYAMNTRKHRTSLSDLPIKLLQIADYHVVDADTSPSPVEALGNLFFSNESYHIERFYSQSFEKGLLKILEEADPFDIIQLETLFMAPYATAIRKHEKVQSSKIVLRAHNVEHEIWEREAKQTQAPWLQYYLEVTAERLKNYEVGLIGKEVLDAIVTVTERDVKKLKDLGAKMPLHTYPIGLEMQRYSAYLSKDSQWEHPSVFFIGALDWIPNAQGLDWFISEVWPLIHSRYPQVNFYIAGRNMPNKYQTDAARNIIALGEVEDAYEFMRTKAIMVVPLFSGGGMRVKIIEGMALEKAIVATSVALEGINLHDGNQAFIANDPMGFANCVSILIEKRQACLTMGLNARMLVDKNYNHAKISKDLLTFFQSVDTVSAKAAKIKAKKEEEAAKKAAEKAKERQVNLVKIIHGVENTTKSLTKHSADLLTSLRGKKKQGDS